MKMKNNKSLPTFPKNSPAPKTVQSKSPANPCHPNPHFSSFSAPESLSNSSITSLLVSVCPFTSAESRNMVRCSSNLSERVVLAVAADSCLPTENYYLNGNFAFILQLKSKMEDQREVQRESVQNL